MISASTWKPQNQEQDPPEKNRQVIKPLSATTCGMTYSSPSRMPAFIGGVPGHGSPSRSRSNALPYQGSREPQLMQSCCYAGGASNRYGNVHVHIEDTGAPTVVCICKCLNFMVSGPDKRR